MAKYLKQFRYYGDGAQLNSPSGSNAINRQNLISGKIFFNSNDLISIAETTPKNVIDLMKVALCYDDHPSVTCCNYVEPTCVTPGYSGVYVCDVCGSLSPMHEMGTEHIKVNKVI